MPDIAYANLNDTIIPVLARLEKNGLWIDQDLFTKKYNRTPNTQNMLYTQYNIFTSTGRPSNAFGGINFAALNTSDETRSIFKSRYGNDGSMILIDYNAFHPRLICYLTKHELSSDIDIYTHLAKLYFKKDEVDERDIKEAKKITFRQIFGGIEPKYLHIRYLADVKRYVDEQWEFFNEHQYIITPIFKRRITKLHIKEPKPYTNFNYMLQAMEGEIALSRLKEVFIFLHGKKTKPVLYTYDSVLYDFYKPDGYDIIEKIYNIMSFNNTFPMKMYEGNSYKDLQLKY